ncbi:MAG TPA: DUF302 domain-containing protein [Polyangiaceae bacterium]|nr:DUF302 domain-containing protein [Polyangiaceae bacterium]
MTDPNDPVDPVDDTNDASFPASDPPEWTGTHAGPPHNAPPRIPAANLTTLRLTIGVDEAVTRIEAALKAAGHKLFARIDHAAEAHGAGLTMPPAVLLIFGNPKGGTALMVARPTVAIDLPFKALVWQDASGTSWLSYNAPSLLVARHGLDPALAQRLAPLGDLLEKAVTA